MTDRWEQSVLIVGGGIGGLCLAQALIRSGIAVTLFERADSPVPERHGYGFHVNPQGDRALRACLPTHLYELYRVTASPAPTGDFVLFTSAMDEVFRWPLRGPRPGDSSTGVAVNRQTLREVLLAELGDVVQFDREFLRYENLTDGRIQARFADGTTAVGDLLVGADGFGSTVRTQLLPGAEFDDLGHSIYGRTPITRELLASIPDVFTDGMPRAADEHGVTMSVGAFVKQEPFDQAADRLGANVVLTPTPDYLRWTLSLRGDAHSLTAKRFWNLQGSALHALAGSLVGSWHPALRSVIEQAEPSATFPFGIHCARPVPRWDEPAITLLGDAIHTMTPGRGEGANTALRDAATLAAALGEVSDGTATLAAAKHNYETEMLYYGFEAAVNSKKPFFAQAMKKQQSALAKATRPPMEHSADARTPRKPSADSRRQRRGI